MVEMLLDDRLGNCDRESMVAIGGDYLTDEQAAALRSFLERLSTAPRKPIGPRNELAAVIRSCVESPGTCASPPA